MIYYEEAIQIIENAAIPAEEEQVELFDALNRVLSRNIYQDRDMPPFDKSAMDGYACKIEDLNNYAELQVIETIAAGTSPTRPIENGFCSKIMTGAPVPEGVNCVVPIEYTEITGKKIRITEKKNFKNICFRGEDIQKGEIALEKGLRLKPQHIGILAAAGCPKPYVKKQLKIGILATGDEIVEPDQTPSNVQIHNSNAYQIWASVKNMAALPTYYGIVEDQPDLLESTIRIAIANNDIVITTGAVSKGDFDPIPLIIQRIGLATKFHFVAIQPGKPVFFAQKENKYFFGLPGNPVASYVCFELFVSHLIKKIQEEQINDIFIKGKLIESFSRKKASRKAWLPVIMNENHEIAFPAYNGSAHIFAMKEANGLICIPIGTTFIAEGEIVDVRPI
jgi:molybdopterin molybdotransferase